MQRWLKGIAGTYLGVAHNDQSTVRASLIEAVNLVRHVLRSLLHRCAVGVATRCWVVDRLRRGPGVGLQDQIDKGRCRSVTSWRCGLAGCDDMAMDFRSANDCVKMRIKCGLTC